MEWSEAPALWHFPKRENFSDIFPLKKIEFDFPPAGTPAPPGNSSPISATTLKLDLSSQINYHNQLKFEEKLQAIVETDHRTRSKTRFRPKRSFGIYWVPKLSLGTRDSGVNGYQSFNI
jgi:hypothetical protein